MYLYVDLDSSFMLKFTSIKSGKSLLPYFRAELLWFVSHTMVCKRVDFCCRLNTTSLELQSSTFEIIV